MPRIQSILCPIDFSDFAVNAYQYAQSLACHYKAKLFLQHVLYPLHGYFAAFGSNTKDYEEVCQQLRTDAGRKLRQFAKDYARCDIRPECVVQDGFATDLILALAEAQAVGLIVMGTHGLRGVDRLMLGSVTEKVLRRARCPVLAVRKPAHGPISSTHDVGPIHLRKILLCMDFSDPAQRASDFALSMAKEYGAELTLAHVLEQFPSSTDLECAIAEVAPQLEQAVPAHERGNCIIKSVVRVGKPYQQIIQLALETLSDLVIMGVRGRGALDIAVFGSTTYRVLQLGPCPVLAVHI